MNYKIRITAENQAIVKRIADENGMNPNNFVLNDERYLYEIQNNIFVYLGTIQKGEEEIILTTEQFIELFDKKETEWQPKRGDRVLVSNLNDNEVELIFVTKIEGSHYPYVVVNPLSEDDFYNNLQFNTSCYKHMKPLPIEQPKESDFKAKVIDLIEKRIEKRKQDLEHAVANKAYMKASTIEVVITIQKDLLNQIKQL
jgi:hypothetical protein